MMVTTFHKQSFLDLKFNNHWVNEYGLLVISDGSRFSESLFPEFSHTTATVPGKTGTVYWGTNITGRTKIIKMMTDGMTSLQYANFKSHYRPGTFAELRFAESAYKYTYAYISEASTFTFVPFDYSKNVQGVTYKDTIFKGECELVFFMPDPYFYSDYYIGKSTDPVFDYTGEDWFIESALPIEPWLNLAAPRQPEDENTNKIQLALGKWFRGLAPTQAMNLTCYHAGNSTAIGNLNFQIEYPNHAPSPDTGFLNGLWPVEGYKIDATVISEPRSIKDIRTVYTGAMARSTDWLERKPQFLIELEESLDSGAAGMLRTMVVAATDVDVLKASIKATFINKKKYAISINGIEKQSRMRSISILTNPTPPEGRTFIIDDNISDAVNNRYITLPPSFGPSSDGALTYSTIRSSHNLLVPELYFRNTYE